MVAATALGMLALAACGGSSSDGDKGEAKGGDKAAVAAAQKRLDPYLKKVTDLDVSTPLTKKVEPGKSVYYIRYNLPIAAKLDPPFKAATAALGWKGTVLAIDASDPQSTSNAMLQAIGKGADYIAVNSGSPEAMGPGLAAAKKAGIPVFMASGVGEVGGESNGVYGNTQAFSTSTGALRLVDLMIVDSDGTGQGLLVNAPDFPILSPIGDQTKKQVAENCSGCSLKEVNIAPQDLGGDVAATVVAALRQDPKVKYVITPFDGLINGLPQALKAAGMDDIKIYVGNATPPTVAGIEKGEIAADLGTPDLTRTWLLVDQIARVSVGMDPEEDAHANMAMQLWTADTIPKGATSWDPPDFEKKFKALWQVS